ncbi:hypothetical protein [Methylocystis bryophila]|uniref:N-acetyltransferase n=1 Tax=Methylocystis bryophila TaxID=655015 RepID=A0A1W6MV31_9HYPH|nr:hypothetical protein [Methylocystis bryophila]ARN81442.1 hypothetical protein B1812_10570 [Methylocystis bryophila]BDV37448.1 hypothetical protein DSM21852_07010 [Methylocystis bryophila]
MIQSEIAEAKSLASRPQVEVVEAKGFAHFLTYNKLPRLLYRGMKGFTAPLDVERWTLHGHKLNPHFKLVEAQEFLARRDGRWIGRIMAQVYKPEFAPVEASRFQFGSLDAEDDLGTVRALTSAAESWLKARGATLIHGPFSPSINGEMGILVDGFEALPVFLTPWHPAYLSRHLEALGYAKARDVYSYSVANDSSTTDVVERMTNRKEWKERLKLREVDFSRLKKGETQLMTDLFNDGWRGNWGYVPFTLDEFNSITDVLGFVTTPDLTIVAELDGQPVAFAVAIPNLFEIIGDLDGSVLPAGAIKVILRLRSHKYSAIKLLLLGMRKEMQGSATGGAILMTMVEEIRRRGKNASTIQEIEAGWVLENNLAMRKPIELFGGKITKTHRIYEKRI